MDDKHLLALVRELTGRVIDSSIKVHDLRGQVVSSEAYRNEVVVAQAVAEAPLKALDEFTDYLIERARTEREAQQESKSIYNTTSVQSVTLNAMLSDLVTRLDQIRRSYGL